MVQNEKITIIVPVYNVEKFLCKCVDSICQQTYKNLEVILIDDGSTDSSSKICDNYCRLDSRVRCIHKENGGLSDARNTGLDSASGDYIMFIDSDDYIVEDMIEKMYSALLKAKADLSICNFCYTDPDGFYDYEKENANPPIVDEVISADQVLKQKIREAKSWYWVIACCKLYKKKIFEDLRFEVGKLHEDEFIFHKIFLMINKVACVSEKMYFYQQRKESIMGNHVNYRKLDCVEALLRRSEEYIHIKGYESIAVFTLLSAASAFHGYYCSAKNKLDEKHIVRNKQLQKEFRTVFNKILKKKVAISVHDYLKIGVNYLSLYYSGKIVHHY